jgi:hypothetical protein
MCKYYNGILGKKDLMISVSVTVSNMKNFVYPLVIACLPTLHREYERYGNSVYLRLSAGGCSL